MTIDEPETHEEDTCPGCGDTDQLIFGKSEMYDEGWLKIPMECAVCATTWSQIYTLCWDHHQDVKERTK